MYIQGNPGILKHALSLLEARGREHVVLLLSEITPHKASHLVVHVSDGGTTDARI